MRTVSAGPATYLDTTTAAPGWRHILTVTPRTGSVVRWTDYFQDLVVSGNTYRAGGEGTTYPKVEVGDREEVEGLEVGKIQLTLQCGSVALFNGTRLTAFAAARGFDGATILVERLYPNPAGGWFDPMHLFSGRVGKAEPAGTRVDLDVESGIAFLVSTELPRRIFQAGCTHMLFDAECTLVKGTFTDTGSTVNASPAPTTTTFSSTLPGGYGANRPSDFYRLGIVTFTSGANAGISRAVRTYTRSGAGPYVGAFVLDEALPFVPVAGDAFDMHPGCEKSIARCGNTSTANGPAYNNLVHFRAWPFVPRNEAAL